MDKRRVAPILDTFKGQAYPANWKLLWDLDLDVRGVLVLAGSRDHVNFVLEGCRRDGVVAREIFELNIEDIATGTSTVHVLRGYAPELFLEETSGLLVVPLQFHETGRMEKTTHALRALKSLIEPGSLVVHREHGIGRYQGLQVIQTQTEEFECAVIQYAGKDRIYLPFEKMGHLKAYGQNDAAHKALDKLGGDFQLKKNRVKQDLMEKIRGLTELYAQRLHQKGLVLSVDHEIYRDFVDQFPFEETYDQAQAIKDLEQDLQSGRPMDRLIVGDVGFGKTEVAMRAAMLTVLAGYKVIVVVPTTLLCFQHLKTFEDRMGSFGIRIIGLNRFLSGKEQRKSIQSLREGSFDVLIATHAVFSQRTSISNVGLLILDEEHKFGVFHKDQLKEMRVNVHVLSLSATPIPRTLQLSLQGIRDLSLIKTPPKGRKSIKTSLIDDSIEKIATAILSERDRGGQVLIIVNRISDLKPWEEKITQKIPDLKIRSAHGQLKGDILENTIVDFVLRKFDVLLSTVIVESGMDIPSVNTLIVIKPELFGLSQLHQMRGRVGRGGTQAYCYLVRSRNRSNSVEEDDRLESLVRHSDLGSGFDISLDDLANRGAGELLGENQTGHVSDIGYEMYFEILNEVSANFEGKFEPQKPDPEIKLAVKRRISADYIRNDAERLRIYRRIADLSQLEQECQLRTELNDRFGQVPLHVDLLLRVGRLRWLLRELGVIKLSPHPLGLEFQLGPLLWDFSKVRTKNLHLRPEERRFFLDLQVPLVQGDQEQLDLIESICLVCMELLEEVRE